MLSTLIYTDRIYPFKLGVCSIEMHASPYGTNILEKRNTMVPVPVQVPIAALSHTGNDEQLPAAKVVRSGALEDSAHWHWHHGFISTSESGRPWELEPDI